jgi:hypothetical protein
MVFMTIEYDIPLYCSYGNESGITQSMTDEVSVRRDPKVLRRVSQNLIKEGLHVANLFYVFE